MNKYIIATLFTLFLSATCYHSSEEEVFSVEFLLGEVEVYFLPLYVSEEEEVVVPNVEEALVDVEYWSHNEEEEAVHNVELLIDIVEDCLFNEEVIPNVELPVDIVEDSLFLSAAGEEEEGFEVEFLFGNVEELVR